MICLEEDEIAELLDAQIKLKTVQLLFGTDLEELVLLAAIQTLLRPE